MKVTAQMPMVKKCPYVDEIDIGTVYFEWDKPAPDFHKVAESVNEYADRAQTHESVTDELAARWGCYVETTWVTGGMRIHVEAQGAPHVPPFS